MTTVELPASEQPAAESDASQERSRQAYRAARRAFRPRRTVPAAIVAALLAAGAFLAAAEVIARLFDRQAGVLPVGWLARLGRETAWQDPLALVVAGALIALGLLLLVLAIRPGRPRVIPLNSGPSDAITVISRRGLARHAAHAAGRVPGVSGTRVTAGRDRLRVRVDTLLYDPQELPEQVHRAVAGRVGQLAPLRPVRLRVAVRRRKGQR